MLVILTGVFSIVGVVVGYCIKLMSDLLIKHQERSNTLEKLIIKKRLSAYEEIISVVRHASIATADFINNTILLQPSILFRFDSYDKWLVDFTIIYSKASHLIDRELDYKLWVFENYITTLDQVYFTKVREIIASSDIPEQIEQEKLSAIGYIVYSDFRKLTSDIVEEASKFYSTGIFRTDFKPSTIRITEYSPPNDFTQLALFSRQRELKTIIEH